MLVSAVDSKQRLPVVGPAARTRLEYPPVGYPDAPDVLPGEYPPVDVDGAELGAPRSIGTVESIAGIPDGMSLVAIRCSGASAATVTDEDNAPWGLVAGIGGVVVVDAIDGFTFSGRVNPPEAPDDAPVADARSEVGGVKVAGFE